MGHKCLKRRLTQWNSNKRVKSLDFEKPEVLVRSKDLEQHAIGQASTACHLLPGMGV